MKVALLKFASSFVLGLLEDESAALLVTEFAAADHEELNGDGPVASAESAIVRLQYPATAETGSWFQPSQIDPSGQQFVAMRFPVLLEVSRLSCDLGAVEAAEVFDVVDSTTALISAAGVEPAGERWQSNEGLIKKYLGVLEGLGVKAKRLSGGRQKVPRDITP